MRPLGLYIHIPFCKTLCPYCDFYKVKQDRELMQKYREAVVKTTASFQHDFSDYLVDTIYFGGGTPSVMDGEMIAEMLDCIYQNFNVSSDAEITVECNPSSDLEHFIPVIASAGVNRISMGMQSAVDSERRALGRLADSDRIKFAVALIKSQGIANISLDLMLGVPGQTVASLDESIAFIDSLDITHVSAYMLKIEDGTVFDRKYRAGELTLPDEDSTCDLYLHAIDALNRIGFHQYEISNFSKEGMESRHNLKYWKLDEYLGIGPAAHSYVDGKRFYYPPDLAAFIDGASPLSDGEGGDENERIMLGLRLTEGLTDFSQDLYNKAVALASTSLQGLISVAPDRIALTKEGFLLSNQIIGMLID